MRDCPRIVDIPFEDFWWSLDGEHYTFESLFEMIRYGNLEAGRIVYGGCRRHPSASDYLPHSSQIIETIGENAWEDAGEFSENFPDISKEGIAELEELLMQWADKYCKVHFWLIDNPYEYEVTEADIDEARK